MRATLPEADLRTVRRLRRAALAFGLHRQGVAWLQARWAAIGPRLRTLLTGKLGAAGVLLICDTLFWVVGRSFLIPGPTG